MFLYATLFGELILLLAFYVPPPFCSVVLTKGFSFMAHHPTVPVIWLGGFNITLTPSLDKLYTTLPSQPSAQVTQFARLIADFKLVDT